MSPERLSSRLAELLTFEFTAASFGLRPMGVVPVSANVGVADR
jgi:hypothetical protein